MLPKSVTLTYARPLRSTRPQLSTARSIAGKVGKTVRSRSGKNLPPFRPKRIFDRDKVGQLRAQGLSIRAIARKLGIGVGTAARTLGAVPKGSSTESEH